MRERNIFCYILPQFIKIFDNTQGITKEYPSMKTVQITFGMMMQMPCPAGVS